MDVYEIDVWANFNGVPVKTCEDLVAALAHDVPDVIRDALGLPQYRIDDNYDYDNDLIASGTIGVYAAVDGQLNAREIRRELEETFTYFNFTPKSCVIG